MRISELPQELILDIQDLLAKIGSAKMDLGESSIAISRFEIELNHLKKERDRKLERCIELEEDQKRLVARIVEMYGEGDLDLQTGKYISK